MTYHDAHEAARNLAGRNDLRIIAIWPIPDYDGALRIWVGVFERIGSGQGCYAVLLPLSHPAWPVETLCGADSVPEALRAVARPLVFRRHYQARRAAP